MKLRLAEPLPWRNTRQGYNLKKKNFGWPQEQKNTISSLSSSIDFPRRNKYLAHLLLYYAIRSRVILDFAAVSKAKPPALRVLQQ